jgi:RHS repeat-associated protein
MYDAWNRQTMMRDDAGTQIAYTSFDALGRRLGKQNASPGATSWIYYYDEEGRVLEVRVGGESAARQHYVWDQRNTDSPIVRFRATTTPGTFDETHFYTQDANGNTTAVVDANSNVVERYSYDPYGQVQFFNASWGALGSSAFVVDVLYAGYFRDSETGLYHVRNRSYHPTLGRWEQRDPLGYHDAMNLYEYVKSTPLTATDPFGLMSVPTDPPWPDELGSIEKWKEWGRKWGKDAMRRAYNSFKGDIRAKIKEAQKHIKFRPSTYGGGGKIGGFGIGIIGATGATLLGMAGTAYAPEIKDPPEIDGGSCCCFKGRSQAIEKTCNDIIRKNNETPGLFGKPLPGQRIADSLAKTFDKVRLKKGENCDTLCQSSGWSYGYQGECNYDGIEGHKRYIRMKNAGLAK